MRKVSSLGIYYLDVSNMDIHPFSYYYCQAFLKPKAAFEKLIKDHRMLRLSFTAVAIPAVLYTFVYVFLIMGGGQPFKPWLDIEPGSYYKYNVFFCAPSMFLGWTLAAAIMHLLSKVFKGTGSFEATLAVNGFGIAIASWATGAHDLLTSFLGGIHIINQGHYELLLNSPSIWRTLLWVQMAAYLLWFVLLFSVGAKVAQGIKTRQSLIIGVTGFVVYQLFFLIFNR